MNVIASFAFLRVFAFDHMIILFYVTILFGMALNAVLMEIILGTSKKKDENLCMSSQENWEMHVYIHTYIYIYIYIYIYMTRY